MSVFTLGERVHNGKISDIAKYGFGVPVVYWDAPPRPAEFAFGPEPFEMWGVPFEYYIPKGTRQAYLVRSGYSADYADFAMKLMLKSFGREATRRFALKALAGVQEYEKREHQLREQAAAAEAAWFAGLQADKERVISELRAGREAKLSRDWAGEVWLRPGGDTAKRQAMLAAVEQEIGKADNNRVQALRKAEQEIAAAQKAREEAVRKAQREVENAARDREQAEFNARLAAEKVAEEARQLKLSRPISLALDPAGIVFGTRIKDGVDFVVPVRQMRHTLCAGVAGSGKSVLLKGLIYQLIRSPEVDRLVLIDLKEGVSFFNFRNSPKCEVIYELPDVMRVIDELMPMMVERLRGMRNDGVELYRGGRTFIIIDEYTEIQSEIDRADKRSPVRGLAENLENLSRRARAAGIVLICALQKPTLDGISAAIRNNMDCRIVLRTATSSLAASMLDDLARLSENPRTLPNGRFYYYDASRGVTRYLQAQVAPGVDLGDVS